ncbi:MAG: hypothetical protein AB7N65_07755 [Vicinamibacterales bacterium]
MQPTRSRTLQIYLATVGLVAIAYAQLGPTLGTGSALLTVGLLLVPAVIVYWIWPDTPGDTAMDIMRRK